MKSKYTMTIFFVITFLHYVSANFAHPITPTLIVNLKLPSYMFGAAFAAMAFTSFLFSPFWGKMREFYPARTLLLVGSLGYAFGQYLFGISHTVTSILLARCVSGFFVGAIAVSTLIYLTEMSEPEKSGENLAKLTIYQSLGGAVGFLVGGSIGLYSISLTFTLQALLIAFCGVLYYFLLEDNTVYSAKRLTAKAFVREINPLKGFLDSKLFMTRSLALLFFVMALVNLGTSAFDQSFNYFIKDQFQFTSIYNGVLKAINGIITLVVNSTVCLWIIRKGIGKKSAGILLAACTGMIALLFGIENVYLFLSVSIVFFGLNSIALPLLQDSINQSANNSNRNAVMGFYNSVRYLGMIIGALLAGFAYGFGPTVPFFLAAICFTLSAVLLLASSRTSTKPDKKA